MVHDGLILCRLCSRTLAGWAPQHGYARLVRRSLQGGLSIRNASAAEASRSGTPSYSSSLMAMRHQAFQSVSSRAPAASQISLPPTGMPWSERTTAARRLRGRSSAHSRSNSGGRVGYAAAAGPAGGSSGSEKLIVVPRPAALSASIFPPCARTRLRAMASPSPLPVESAVL
jgi:hypothetical protein